MTAPSGANSAPTAKPETDPIKPIQVKTVKVKMVSTQATTPALSAGALGSAQIVVQDASQDRTLPATVAPQVATTEEAKRQPERDLIAEAIRETAPPPSAPQHPAPPAPSLHSGWIIQVGAFDVEREARERLSTVQAKVGQILKHANPFTEAVVMGDKTLYRARFAGVQKDQAEAICRQLKRNDIACMTIKN